MFFVYGYPLVPALLAEKWSCPHRFAFVPWSNSAAQHVCLLLGSVLPHRPACLYVNATLYWWLWLSDKYWQQVLSGLHVCPSSSILFWGIFWSKTIILGRIYSNFTSLMQDVGEFCLHHCRVFWRPAFDFSYFLHYFLVFVLFSSVLFSIIYFFDCIIGLHFSLPSFRMGKLHWYEIVPFF